TPCCGSPTAKLIGDWPGSTSPKSSRSRTNGERPISARGGEGGETRSAAVMNIDKAAPTLAAQSLSYHRGAEGKAGLTQPSYYYRSFSGLEIAKWLTRGQLATFVYDSSGSFAIARRDSTARLAHKCCEGRIDLTPSGRR